MREGVFLSAEKENLACAEEDKVLTVMGAAFVSIVAADALVFEDTDAGFLGAGGPGFGQGIGRVLVAGLSGFAGFESGDVIGAQGFERCALNEIEAPRLSVFRAGRAASGLDELFDDVGGHEFGFELADGATCMHGFKSAEIHSGQK